MSRTKHHINKSSFERKAKRAFSIYRKKYREARLLSDEYIELPLAKNVLI